MTASGTFSILLSLLLPSVPAHAQSADALREQCLARVDALHACACNDVRGSSPQDAAAFDLNRADIQAVYQAFRKSPHFTPGQDAKLIAALKRGYDEQRELLSCHDNVGVKLSNYIVAEEYCVHEKKAAAERGKPLCKNAGDREMTIAADKVRAEADRRLPDFDHELKRLSWCSADLPITMEYTRGVAMVYPPCRIDLKSLFPDNQSVLTAAQAAKIVDYIKSHACFQRYLANGQTLQKVEIHSSSSRLANTGAAAKKTFLQLSEERAGEIESKIVSAVLDAAILERVKFEKNAKGINGDGTSGACPYAYDSKRGTWMRKTFPTNEQLESNKRTELNFYFGDHVETVDSDIHSDLMTIPCKEARFYCR